MLILAFLLIETQKHVNRAIHTTQPNGEKHCKYVVCFGSVVTLKVATIS